MAAADSPKRALDRTDRKLLSLLERDARLSTAELARRVEMSGPAVAERIARLIDTGVIAGCRTEIDPAALGLGMSVMIEFTPYGPDVETAVARVAGVPEVTDCYRVTGTAFLILFAHVRNNRHLNDMLLSLAAIGSTKTSVVLNVEFEGRSLLPPVD
jgi:Lrp/AsnC family leucine-responsive transcriptional regulator